MVDEKDFDILALLARDPFLGNERIGDSLGLSGNAVKKRLAALEAGGVVPSTWLFPIPQVFRRHSRVFVYKDMKNPEAAVRRALSFDPIVWSGFDMDGSFHVHAYATEPDGGPPAGLVEALGDPVYSVSPPLSDLTVEDAAVSSLDLRILLVLLRQPRASLQAIANQTGLSPKTVRRHRDAMFANGLFMLFPVIHVAQARGIVLYNAYAQGPRVPSNAQAIADALPRSRLVTAKTVPPGVWLIGWAETLAEVSEVEARLKRLPVVDTAGIILRLRVEFALERVEGWIHEELARWGRPSPKGPGIAPSLRDESSNTP